MGGEKQKLQFITNDPRLTRSAFTFIQKNASFCGCLASKLTLLVNIEFNMNYGCTFLTKLASAS